MKEQQSLKYVAANPEVEANIRKGPSPEARKLLRAFLMRTSVPRIAAQILRERENESEFVESKSQLQIHK